MNKNIYLDYAAATPVDPAVNKAMQPYFVDKFFNPSATYLAGRAIRQDIAEARQSVASNIGARPGEIIFTAGATEANNLAIAGIMKQFTDGQIIVSAIEHESVLSPAQEFKAKVAPVDAKGIVDLEKLKSSITDQTVLISIMLINNEIGTIQPLKEIAALVAEVRIKRQKSGNKKPLYLHTDAAQAGNLLDHNVARLNVDMMSINGGKIYGPKQTGVLYVRAGVVLKPIISGGGQEMNMRSGTENVAGIIGFAKALEIAQSKRSIENHRIKKIRDVFVIELSKKIPDAVINGSNKHQSPHILHITLPGQDNERLMMELDELGFQCAVGSACSASSQEPSHVLKAIGLTDEQAHSSLRISFGKNTSEKDAKKTVKALKSLMTH